MLELRLGKEDKDMRQSISSSLRHPRWLRAVTVLGFGLLITSCSSDEPDGAGCSAADNGDGTYDLNCDGTVITIPGSGDGSCTSVDNGDGSSTITCDDGTSVTIENGAPGADGTNGADGADGTNGTPGADGTDGTDGADGLGIKITDRHGTDMLLSTGEYATAGKYFADAAITAATADEAGVATVTFTVADENGDPVVGLASASFSIVKLVPAADGKSFNEWVPYSYRTETVSGAGFPQADGYEVDQGYRESSSAGTFVDNGDGSYTYTFALDLTSVTKPVSGEAVAYDRTLTHRVSVFFGGHSGATAEANFDFVPDGSTVTETRNIVETASCQSCHGGEFHGHGGDRLNVEGCVTCHNPSTFDAQSGESLDMKVMIHKIHAGAELASIPGADGIVWDNPATTEDETADNGEYALWGHRTSKHEWWEVGFPAVIENCTKCHQGAGEDVDNWKEAQSRDACGSCHDDVDFAVGTNHTGGLQTDDLGCAFCHGEGRIADMLVAHDWVKHDPRKTPEFDVSATFSGATGGGGAYFQAGDVPVITVVLTDKVTGLPIDHTTMEFDSTKQGCTDAEAAAQACPERNGKFSVAYLFVHGPRAKRNPVLTTAARVEIVSGGTGPFDLSAAGASLALVLDGGKDLFSYDAHGGDTRIPGTLDVKVSAGTFANTSAAAEAAEVVDWLNGNSAFAARAIAYLENGAVAIRSRNLGEFFSLQLKDGVVTDEVFGGDTSVKVVGGYYPSNGIYRHADPADDDPKAAWTEASVTYTLDPVDDLEPGTYVASFEIADRGRVGDTDYSTPSVGKFPFQVKTATEELAPAGSCGSCHQGPEGTGFVLDWARHNKIFDDTAIDQCAGCHDYQPQGATGTAWGGGKAISKRVHAVHYGADLNYPNATVDYRADPVTGRNWNITLPQDIRNCEVCHDTETSSGSWMTEAARVPCSGCHDSDNAAAHMKLQTWDPTPADPWNGDEEESCKTCH